MSDQMPYEPDMGRLLSLNSDNREFTLQMGVFNRTISFALFRRDVKGRPPVKCDFDSNNVALMVHLLKKILKGDQGKMETLVRSDWDRENKRRNIVANLVIGKDERGVIYLDLGSPNQPSVRFSLNMGQNVAVEGITDNSAVVSQIAAGALILRLETAMTTLTAMPNKNRMGFGGGNRGGAGGGGGNRSGGYSGGGGNRGGYDRGGASGGGNSGGGAASSPPAGGDDDLF